MEFLRKLCFCRQDSRENNDLRRTPAMSFLQPPAQQKASTKVRAQVALAPGHGLMDWIRKMNGTPNISGTNGKVLAVTEEELAKHNTRNDCWMAISGSVYNVTPYLDYHPGGVDELMRGAGIDATTLFQDVHSWVNYASMLEKCLVGRLISSSAGSTNKTAPTRLRFHSALMDKKFLRLFIGTNDSSLTTEQIFLHLDHSKVVTGFIYLDGHIHTISIELSELVEDQFDVRISTTDKTQYEILLKKKVEQPWRTIGKFRPDHLTFHSALEPIYFTSTLIERSTVTHDTDWYTFSIPPNVYIRPPTGFHVRLKRTKETVEIVKPYTVVSKFSVDNDQQTTEPTIQLMIKHYNDGIMTPLLKQMKKGDTIEMSACEGNFDLNRLQFSQTIILIAAGTGLTPMIRVLNYLCQNTTGKNLTLLFFNKTEKDILCRTQLETLANRHHINLHHILSQETSNSWSGAKGHISAELLDRFVAKPSEGKKSESNRTLICVCGPTAFTKLTVDLLVAHGFTDDLIHIFAG